MTIWFDQNMAAGAVETGDTPKQGGKFPYLLKTLAIFYDIAAWPFRRARRLREMRLLVAMSDRDLSDIGLSRQDVNDVVTLPLSWDTGHFLFCRRTVRKR